jgi:hypothetical protein
MQREIKKGPTVRSKWPLFCWKKCIKCEQEFRREWLWSVIYIVPSFLTFRQMSWNIYLCRQCAPSLEEAEEFFQSYRLRRPKITPPPPMRPPKKEDTEKYWIITPPEKGEAFFRKGSKIYRLVPVDPETQKRLLEGD